MNHKQEEWEDDFEKKFAVVKLGQKEQFTAEYECIEYIKNLLSSKLNQRTLEVIDEIPDKYTAIEVERNIEGREWIILKELKQQLKDKYGIK